MLRGRRGEGRKAGEEKGNEGREERMGRGKEASPGVLKALTEACAEYDDAATVLTKCS